MMFLLKVVRGSLMTALAGCFIAAQVEAGILEQYEFQGQTGSETSLAPLANSVASGLTGLSVAESSGLTPSTGANSINASGWTTSGQFYSLGFNVNAGYTATVNQIILTSRSSGTGPGFINVNAVVDGGPMITVATITQNGTNYNDEYLSITPVTATKSLLFYFTPSNTTSANGGSTGSAGTFRLGDYNPSGTPTPFTINGTITQSTPPAAVPEPAAISMVALGLALVGIAGRARLRAS